MNLIALKNAMKARGVSQAKIAELLGRQRSAVTKIFKGERSVSTEEAVRIARFLRVPVSSLLEEEDYSPPIDEALLEAIIKGLMEAIDEEGISYTEESFSYAASKIYSLMAEDKTRKLDKQVMLAILGGRNG